MVFVRALTLTSRTLRITHQTLKRHLSVSGCLLNRLYTEKHEWIAVDGHVGTVGISNHAQESLGDVVYAQLPNIDETYQQNHECGALESVKAVSEIFCPVSGQVTELNKEVEANPGLINKSCYDKGWLFKIKLTKEEELKKLMNEAQYEEFLKSEEH